MLLSGPIAPFDRTDKEDRQRGPQRFLPQRSRQEFHPSARALERALRRRHRRFPPSPPHRLDPANRTRSPPPISSTKRRAKLAGKRLVPQGRRFPGSGAASSLDRNEQKNFVPPDDTRTHRDRLRDRRHRPQRGVVLDLANGELKNVSRSPDHYEEVEGASPMENTPSWSGPNIAGTTGRSSMRVEVCRSTAQAMPSASPSSRTSRVTRAASRRERRRALLAFTLGKSGMEAGQGFGLVFEGVGKSEAWFSTVINRAQATNAGTRIRKRSRLALAMAMTRIDSGSKTGAKLSFFPPPMDSSPGPSRTRYGRDRFSPFSSASSTTSTGSASRRRGRTSRGISGWTTRRWGTSFPPLPSPTPSSRSRRLARGQVGAPAVRAAPHRPVLELLHRGDGLRVESGLDDGVQVPLRRGRGRRFPEHREDVQRVASAARTRHGPGHHLVAARWGRGLHASPRGLGARHMVNWAAPPS